MEVLRGKQVDQLAQDCFNRGVDRTHARVEAVVREPLNGVVDARLFSICQFGQRREQGVAVTGHVDLRHDIDAEILRQVNDVANRVLGVVAAIGFGPGTEQRWQHFPVTAPGGVLRQRRIGVDLDTPRLVVAQVPVEDIELVPAHDREKLLDLFA